MHRVKKDSSMKRQLHAPQDERGVDSLLTGLIRFL